MCGRFTMFSDDEELARLFDVDVVEGEHHESYNEAPSQLIRAVRTKRDERRELDLMRWGLIPFWAKESFHPLINARAETVTEKPSFRTPVSKRRCLLPTNGYYEWQKNEDGEKRPFFLSLANSQGQPAPLGAEPTMAMAGIFDWPRREDGDQERSEEDFSAPPTTAIITRPAADTLGHIHDRMPLFVPKSLWEAWLDPNFQNRDELREMIRSIPTPPLVPREVGKAVGNVRNNGPELIVPVH